MRDLVKWNKQVQYYKNQQNAYHKLVTLDEFTYVIDYWEREADEAMRQLGKRDQEHIQYRQAKYNTAIDFLNFCNNISSAEDL